MLEVGSDGAAEKADGLPLVQMPDELEEVITLLHVIYYAEYV